MAIAKENDDHNRDVDLRGRLASAFLIWLGGGWHPRTEVPPKGRVWTSDGQRVWWIWTDGEGIPDTATACKFWMPFRRGAAQPPGADDHAFAGPVSDPVEVLADLKALENAAAMRRCLEFYAKGHHLILGDADAWDTVSGEPQNFLCDAAGTATVEDGTLAKMTLEGKPINWGEDGQEQLPLESPTATKDA